MINIANRQSDLAKIHIAIKQLGLSDAEHRRRLMLSFGKDSSSGLTDAERKHYLADLCKLGFKAKPKSKTKIDRTQDVTPQMRKARAIWLMLHDIGVVRDPSESALTQWARRQYKIDALQWQQRPDLLIEALKKWAMRHLPAWCGSHPKFKDAVKTIKSMTLAEIEQQPQPQHHLLLLALRLQHLRIDPFLFDAYCDCWDLLSDQRVDHVS
jgi:phage gp16-like protein